MDKTVARTSAFQESERDQRALLKTMSVLCVEDEEGIRENLAEFLERVVGMVFTAENGEEGLEVYNRELPDIVMTDINMPVMNGLEMARKIRETHPNVQIIISTAYSEQSFLMEAIEIGISRYAIKPLKRDNLMSALYKCARVVNLEREAAQYHALLESRNEELERRVAEEIEKNRHQERILVQQSRMAAMGEMLGVIAHQWKQPLNVISLLVQGLLLEHEDGTLDKGVLQQTVDDVNRQVNFMSETANHFRRFLKPSTEPVLFLPDQEIDDVVFMLRPMLEAANIRIFREQNGAGECRVKGFPNEFKQVILNIINNGRDAILERRDREPEFEEREGVVRIASSKEGERVEILFEDNGGGIPPELLPRIFEDRFSTKGEEGTGIGLSMSKIITESHMGGSLDVENGGEGARFTIRLPLASRK